MRRLKCTSTKTRETEFEEVEREVARIDNEGIKYLTERAKNDDYSDVREYEFILQHTAGYLPSLEEQRRWYGGITGWGGGGERK